VLIRLDARRYFKQSEIILYRQAPDPAGNQHQIMASAPDNSSKIMPGAMQSM
jgi:vacuolar protein sorting-associated protein 26